MITTRVALRFNYGETPKDERDEKENQLLNWMRDNGYQGAYLTGSLVFREITVSFDWDDNKDFPTRTVVKKTILATKINELFGLEG